MIEEGLYDNEPSYVRATVYERVLGEVPVAGFDVHDALIDQEKLMAWIKEKEFILFHCKLADYNDDGEERTTRYYVHREKKQMITIRRCFIDPAKELDIRSSDNSPLENQSKTNPNKLDWFSFYAPSEDQVHEFKKFFDTLRIKEDTKSKLYMLKATEYNGLELDSFPTSCEGMSLEMNYGTAFQKDHEHIIDCLKNKKSGLYVFHGPPGTGKTSYIKYLTTVVENRKFIFVPNTMVAELFSPKLVDKLYSFKNSVLVLEDAEVCVFKRDGNNNALVSGILNITDGLLKDLLNIAIVVTFNAADVTELDVALLRKGRLKIMHRFDLLSMEDAKNLAQHLKRKKSITSAMTLADVYNLDEETGLEDIPIEKKVGFGA